MANHKRLRAAHRANTLAGLMRAQAHSTLIESHTAAAFAAAEHDAAEANRDQTLAYWRTLLESDFPTPLVLQQFLIKAQDNEQQVDTAYTKLRRAHDTLDQKRHLYAEASARCQAAQKVTANATRDARRERDARETSEREALLSRSRR